MRTADYAVELHPEADPLDLTQLLVTFMVCELCGAIVHDDLLHGTWHDRMDAAQKGL
jgi:hypothetical protein